MLNIRGMSIVENFLTGVNRFGPEEPNYQLSRARLFGRRPSESYTGKQRKVPA